ncbi:dioxygenase [Pseudomonas corrugata]|uniref:DODA-type extradiol aromatic ring-opening family dioxygenase n=1 Tax=Pseudomonas corrugata TaxID=47879 RepID=UPI00223191AD|nr:class III extradiol ring-cleavage dioxygenase [Pseudomonas corrugata]UZD97712.1 dioxygenase [Pseudomonas corrugata]
MTKQPTFYITHGAGPCFWTDWPAPFGPHAFDGLKNYFSGMLGELPVEPQAILMISAHWEAPVPTVSTAAAPRMHFDYSGFPEHTYRLNHAARGFPPLGSLIQDLLNEAGFTARADRSRGYDHGVFVPMLIIDPEATIPIVMLSMEQSLDASRHLAMGKALAALRAEGVLIIGSGSSFHNLGTIGSSADCESSVFDGWLNETLCQVPPEERTERLSNWKRAPGAAASHPRPDHLIPLMVATGAAQDSPGRRTFTDVIGGKTYSCFSFGEL